MIRSMLVHYVPTDYSYFVHEYMSIEGKTVFLPIFSGRRRSVEQHELGRKAFICRNLAGEKNSLTDNHGPR